MTLALSSRRYLLRHPWLTALSILGVALGVAVSVAVDLANGSALRAFELSGEAVTGRATHQVIGGPGGVPGALVARVRAEGGVANVAPVVEGDARVARERSRVVGVLGVDPFEEAAFRPFVGGPGSGLDAGLFLTVPGAALVSEQTAAELGLAVGDTLGLQIDGRSEVAHVIGLLQPGDDRSASALQNLLVVDVATGQEWFGLERDGAGRGGKGVGGAEPNGAGSAEVTSANPSSSPIPYPSPAPAGRLSRIDLLLPDSAAVARVAALLPAGAEVRPASTQAETLATMTEAFRLNLSALSLLALVVGLFLIYNTVTFAVVQRRRVLGTYRALGVTRGEVFRLVLVEALVVGAVGTALGLALGVALGSGLVRLVTQTIGDLYFVVRVRELALSPWALAKGAVLGLGATLVGALRPGWEAASVAPASALRRSTQEDRIGRGAGRLALGGAAALASGGLVLLLPAGVVGAYAGMLGILVGVALLTPWLTRVYAAAAQPLMARLMGPVGRMAARGIATSLSRTAVAVAALTVAVAATIGVATMVSSFRTTVEDWLGSVLQSDVYVQPPATVFRRGGAVLDPALARDLAALPGVERTDAIRIRTLDGLVRSGGNSGGAGDGSSAGRFDLVVSRIDATRAGVNRYKEGSAEAFAAAAPGGAVAVSEPFAFRFGVGVGDTLRLPTDRGPRAYPVAAVYIDYGNDLGVVLMDERPFLAAYDDPGYAGTALTAAPGVDPDDLVASAQALAEGRQDVTVRSTRALRQASLDIFDQTFVVTSVLRLLAVGVAFVGVLSALLALQLERRRELAMLRAQGMTPGELRKMVLAQTGLMGLWAGLLSVPLGLALAAVLVFVVNVRSFGWTLAFVVSPSVLLQAVGLAVAAALLAGAYPAWRMSTTSPAIALREE
ncbi:FtsX-like permease family protein [Rubrivirga litoralis]|uniref:FtsX-like permease family protein n=1 Tax=Rubrivirga litoralis TaxID=3075598 RepID=A0ABU3BPD3_9BACT|nr:FtsX-like permease family protein [Rubrivirga sp. F394]MDT0631151.1 FtsX-like permease family protein [Rubrivirga sp. F394]